MQFLKNTYLGFPVFVYSRYIVLESSNIFEIFNISNEKQIFNAHNRLDKKYINHINDKNTKEKKRVYYAEKKNDVIKLYYYDSSGDKTMTTITRSNVNYENANKAYKAILAFDKKTKVRF